MLPFRQNREQAMRAARLADRGLLGVIDEADLAPERLAALMTEQLGRRPDPAGIDLNGAAASAGILTRLAEEAK
jgi:predicted glycosyltransferase